MKIYSNFNIFYNLKSHYLLTKQSHIIIYINYSHDYGGTPNAKTDQR